MKAVILERKGSDAAVLSEDGTFMKVRHEGDVGEEIEIAEQSVPMRIWRSGTAKFLTAAAIVLALIGGSYHYMAVSVSAYVSVDAGGSSVEFAVNRLGRVTEVVSVSDDDIELVKALSDSVRGMSVEDAVNRALDTITENGETASGGEPVIVGITSDSEGQAESIENAINDKAEFPVHLVRVSGNEREEAHKQDIGGGAYVYGTEDAPEAVADEQRGDNAPAAAETEVKIFPVFDTVPPLAETQETAAAGIPAVTETENIVPDADIPQEQPDAAASPERPGIPEIDTLRQSGPSPSEAPQDIPEAQDEADPIPGTENPPQQNEQPDDIPPGQSGEQNGQMAESPAPEEIAASAQNGQQPDTVPPGPPGAYSGQGPEIPMSVGDMPQEQPPTMSGTMMPPMMTGSDMSGQR